MKKIKKALPYIAALATPFFALAQSATGIQKIVTNISAVVNQIVPILLVIGTIVFLWGVIMFLTAGADEEKRANARSLMIYGLVGLFVMVAAWGIVNLLVGFTGTGNIGIPSNVGGLNAI